MDVFQYLPRKLWALIGLKPLGYDLSLQYKMGAETLLSPFSLELCVGGVDVTVYCLSGNKLGLFLHSVVPLSRRSTWVTAIVFQKIIAIPLLSKYLYL
jgi:hypothetical protein